MIQQSQGRVSGRSWACTKYVPLPMNYNEIILLKVVSKCYIVKFNQLYFQKHQIQTSTVHPWEKYLSLAMKDGGRKPFYADLSMRVEYG